LIDPEGRAKVTDFGIALSQEADGLTRTGRVLGTTDYVSPEQAMGKPVDDRSDVYSLGILLYEMLRGDVPFKAETLVGVAMKHVNDPMPDIQASRPGTSSALAAVIERATQKDPKKRYRDMGAMLADLEGALEVEIARAGGATGEATTVLNSVPSRQRLLSSRSVSIVGILLVLAGVLVALALVELGGEADQSPSEVEGSATAPSSGDEITLSNPVDYDPSGDSEEHPEAVERSIDGDAATFWFTETYEAGPALEAAGKPGVGLVFEASEVVTGRSIEIQTPDPGWTAEIYGAVGGPPADLEGWGEPLTSSFEAREDSSIPLTEHEADHYLIWITELTENVDDGGFFATIGEVALFD
jgi:serine/threonine-protein kinase